MKLEFPSEYWKDYELIDCGEGEKLERFGDIYLARPEAKAIWSKGMSNSEWDNLIHRRFKAGSGKGKPGIEDSGEWIFPQKASFKNSKDSNYSNSDCSNNEQTTEWIIEYNSKEVAPESNSEKSNSEEVNSENTISENTSGKSDSKNALNFKLKLSLTTYKHVGVFPEQASNWEYIYKNIQNIEHSLHSDKEKNKQSSNEKSKIQSSNEKSKSQSSKPKILNMFAYTGAASLTAKAAGADIIHLDAIRPVITWAKENMELSQMDGIRWLPEDALKFARREVKRGHKYNGIILDPPAYGNGPKNEKWKLDSCIDEMMECVAHMLEPQNSFMILNLYADGYTPEVAEMLVRNAFRRAGKPIRDNRYSNKSSRKGTRNKKSATIETGMLALKDRFDHTLPLSTFVRVAF